MNTFRKISAIATVSVVALAGAALAQVTPAADEAAAQAAAQARFDLMNEMGGQMEMITPMLRNQAPFDAAVIGQVADAIIAHAAEIPAAFAVDTSGFDGLIVEADGPDGARVSSETKARDAIWQSHDAFLEKSEALEAAAVALKEAVAAGERGPITRAVGAMGQSCGSCHDDYQDDA